MIITRSLCFHIAPLFRNDILTIPCVAMWHLDNAAKLVFTLLENPKLPAVLWNMDSL